LKRREFIKFLSYLSLFLFFKPSLAKENKKGGKAMAFVEYKPINFREVRPQLWQMDGISQKTMDEHIKLYEGYVAKYNECMKLLENLPEEEYNKANPTYSLIRSIKVDITRAIGGIKNHELYFSHLGGKGGKPEGKLLEQIEKDFGSYERFLKELRATAIAARGWAWVAYDHNFKRLFIAIGDEQNTFPIWNATPILGIDVFEHAFFIDYGTAKAKYLDAFFNNLDWKVVEKNYEAISKS
jgi:Fe-Mn family superoxide dismutase